MIHKKELADDVYNAFLLVPLYLGMYYKHDLHIHGCVSKRFYRNINNYLQRILCDFSDDLSRINVTVDCFKECDGDHNIIGAGISCGVDSLTTIYDRFVNESDPEYKINGLFLFNTGTFGNYGEKCEKVYFLHSQQNKRAADELGLPVYQVNSNIHAFTHKVGSDPKAGYFAIWSCIIALEKALNKYYVSSTYSYNQILTFGKNFHDRDFAQFSESYSVPLIRTDRLELISDGCQYERNEKVERIADWNIAQKYLNVCYMDAANARNCSKCAKCTATLLALEAINKLENFSGVFDLDTYKKISWREKKIAVFNHFENIISSNEPDPYLFLKRRGVKLPSRLSAYLLQWRRFPGFVYLTFKNFIHSIVGDKIYYATKKFVKGS